MDAVLRIQRITILGGDCKLAMNLFEHMVSFCVQNMSLTWRNLSTDLFTDNICKLGCVTKWSGKTYVLHEYNTEKCDSMTSYVIHHSIALHTTEPYFRWFPINCLNLLSQW